MYLCERSVMPVRKIVDFLAFHLDSMLIFLYNTLLLMLIYVLWTIPVSEVNVFFWVLCAAVCAEGKTRKKERKALSSLKIQGVKRSVSAALTTGFIIFGVYLAAPDIYTGWMWLGFCIYAGYVVCAVICFFFLQAAELKSLLWEEDEDEEAADIVPPGLVVWHLCRGSSNTPALRENIYEMLRTVEGQEFFLEDLREAIPAVKRSVVNEIFLCCGDPGNTAEETSITLFALRLALFSCLEAYCVGEISALLPGSERRLANRMYESAALEKMYETVQSR